MKKLLFFFFLCFFSVANANDKGRIRMIFRYDDYTLTLSRLNDTILDIFKRNGIPLTIGVIPFDENSAILNNFDSNRIGDLKSRIGRNEIEVALHGFNHKNIVKGRFLKRHYYSEFATESYNRQYYEIKRGKKVLDSLLNINIGTFIPPFDTYDNKTLEALSSQGFKTISASIFSSTSCVCDNEKISYIPATIRDFFGVQAIIDRYRDQDVTVVLYFHPYTFRSQSLSYSDEYDPSHTIKPSQLDSFLQWISKQKGIDFYTFSGLEKSGDFNKALYDANFYKDNLMKSLLYKVKRFHNGVYLPAGYDNDHNGLFIGNIILHIVVFAVVFFVAFGIVRLFRPGRLLITACLSIIILAASMYLYYFIDDSSFRMKLLLIAVVIIATVLGTLHGRNRLFLNRKVSPMIL